MSKVSRAINLLKSNKGEFCASLLQNLSFLFPDKLYLTLLFRCKMGYWIDWKNPKTFSEKLQWLKLYNRKPEYTTMVDKYAVKEYVAKLIGEEYIIPTLGVWDTPEEINWDELPNQFVLKTTHDSGTVIVCKDKNEIDFKIVKKRLKKSLKKNYFYHGREWPYKNVKRRIIAEEYICDGNSSCLVDYKFYCFGGEVKYVTIANCRDSDQGPFFDYFDINFNRIPLKWGGPNFFYKINKPLLFEKMKILASVISKNIVHARVDLYEVKGFIKFGEITFFDSNGLVPFEPNEWDYKFGEFISLPKIDNK